MKSVLKMLGLNALSPGFYALAISLFLPVQTGLPVLALGFLLVLILDLHQYRYTIWFRQLRIQISLSVAGLLFFSWSFT